MDLGAWILVEVGGHRYDKPVDASEALDKVEAG